MDFISQQTDLLMHLESKGAAAKDDKGECRLLGPTCFDVLALRYQEDDERENVGESGG